MIFARWRARRANRALIDQIHGEIVAAARAPALYPAAGRRRHVSTGRFEMVALHAGLRAAPPCRARPASARHRAGARRPRLSRFRRRACARWRSATPASRKRMKSDGRRLLRPQPRLRRGARLRRRGGARGGARAQRLRRRRRCRPRRRAPRRLRRSPPPRRSTRGALEYFAGGRFRFPAAVGDAR